MPTKTWTVGEEVLASDFNAFVQQQVVATFATAAARTTGIPAPSEGMVTWLNDTNRLEVYDGTAWRPPWNLPWGLVTYLTPADVAGIGGPLVIAGSAFSFPVVGRRMHVSAHCNLFKASGGQGDARLNLDVTAVVPMPGYWNATLFGTPSQATAYAEAVVTSSTTVTGGSIGVVPAVGTVDMAYLKVKVVDLGPA